MPSVHIIIENKSKKRNNKSTINTLRVFIIIHTINEANNPIALTEKHNNPKLNIPFNTLVDDCNILFTAKSIYFVRL